MRRRSRCRPHAAGRLCVSHARRNTAQIVIRANDKCCHKGEASRASVQHNFRNLLRLPTLFCLQFSQYYNINTTVLIRFHLYGDMRNCKTKYAEITVFVNCMLCAVLTWHVWVDDINVRMESVLSSAILGTPISVAKALFAHLCIQRESALLHSFSMYNRNGAVLCNQLCTYTELTWSKYRLNVPCVTQ